MKTLLAFVFALVQAAPAPKLAFQLEYAVPRGSSAREIADAVALLHRQIDDASAWNGVQITLVDETSLRVRVGRVLNPAEIELLRRRVEGRDVFAMLPLLDEKVPGVDEFDEHLRWRVWRKDHPVEPIVRFNALSRDDGGPARGVRWYPSARAGDDAAPKEVACVDPQVVHADRDWTFEAKDVKSVDKALDNLGHPAIGFELAEDRAKDFLAFTTHYVDRQVAVIVEGRVLSDPVINTPLPAAGVIEGALTEQERDRALERLRTKSLRLEFIAARELR